MSFGDFSLPHFKKKIFNELFSTIFLSNLLFFWYSSFMYIRLLPLILPLILPNESKDHTHILLVEISKLYFLSDSDVFLKWGLKEQHRTWEKMKFI